MNKYELVVIVDAALPQEEKADLLKDVGDAIAKYDGKVINNQVWLEKQKFFFHLKKRTEGTYYLVNFESAPSGVTKLRQLMKLNEKILRTLIINVE